METPPKIKEEGTRWTVENARPLGLRLAFGFVGPIVLMLDAYAIFGDVRDQRWGMLAIRVVFGLIVATATVFSLFGAETLAVEGSDVVWRRGRTQQRRVPVGEIEKLERTGNQLRVHVRGDERPIVIGAGLRQSPAAMKWLIQRLDAAIIAAKKGT